MVNMAKLTGRSGTLNGRLPDDAPILENLMMSLAPSFVPTDLLFELDLSSVADCRRDKTQRPKETTTEPKRQNSMTSVPRGLAKDFVLQGEGQIGGDKTKGVLT